MTSAAFRPPTYPTIPHMGWGLRALAALRQPVPPELEGERGQGMVPGPASAHLLGIGIRGIEADAGRHHTAEAGIAHESLDRLGIVLGAAVGRRDGARRGAAGGVDHGPRAEDL